MNMHQKLVISTDVVVKSVKFGSVFFAALLRGKVFLCNSFPNAYKSLLCFDIMIIDFISITDNTTFCVQIICSVRFDSHLI